MLSAVWKALAVLALAQGLNAKPALLPSVAQYKGQHVVQVLGADTHEKVQTLEENVNEVFMRSFSAGGMTARVSTDQVATLKELGFGVKVVVEDVAEHLSGLMASDGKADYRASSDPDAYYTKYHNDTEIFRYINDLMDTKLADGVNKAWLTKKTIGQTWEKRPIVAVEIGNPKAKEAIYMEGGLHAAEWAGIWGAQYVLREWINKFASGTEAELFEKFRFIIVPLVNVDGFRYSYIYDRLWRKNRRINSNLTCPGVDLNRNYNGFEGWKLEPNQCARYYSGPWKYSEPETKTMVKYLQELKKKHRLIAMLDIHSFAEYILYPYGYDFNLPPAPNVDQLVECGTDMATAMNKVDSQNYTVMNAADWYPGYGCADDYWYDKIARGPWAEKKGLVYTVEMRPIEGDPIGFALPEDQILATAKELYAGYEAVVAYVVKALA